MNTMYHTDHSWRIIPSYTRSCVARNHTWEREAQGQLVSHIQHNYVGVTVGATVN